MIESECVLLYNSAQISRKIGRVMKREKSFGVTVLAWKHFLLGWRLLAAPIDSSAVSLSKFKMLTRWYRIGSSCCSLNNIHWFPQSSPAFAAASVCGCSEVNLRFFSKLFMVSYVRLCSCVHLTIICESFSIYLQWRLVMMLCGIVVMGFVTGVCCYTSSTGSSLQTSQASHNLRCYTFEQFRLFLLIILAE